MEESGHEEPRSTQEAYAAHRGDVARRLLADPALLPQPWNGVRTDGWPLAEAVFVYMPEVLRNQVSLHLGLRAEGVPFPDILERLAHSGWIYLRQRLSSGELSATGIADGTIEPSPMRASVFDSSEFDYAAGAVLIGSKRILGVRIFDLATEPKPDQTLPKPLSNPKGGADEVYDWEEFRRELFRAAFAGEVSDRRGIRRHMKEWCSKAWIKQPDESRIRQILKPLLHESIPENHHN